MPGYSNKSLRDKLGLKTGAAVHFIDPPEGYLDLLEPQNWTVVDLNSSAEFIHAFYLSRQKLKDDALLLEKSLKLGGILWVSWPKKSSGVLADIGENDLREILLPTGLVDIKVAAITETWSGLKFVRRVNKLAKH